MANIIPHGTIICDQRVSPWINNRIKKIIHERNNLCKDYHKNNEAFTEVASGYGGIEGYSLLKSVYKISKTI